MTLFLNLITFLIPYQVFITIFENKQITVFIVLTAFAFLFGSKDALKAVFKPPFLFYIGFILFVVASFFYSQDKADALKHVYYFGLAAAIYGIYASSKNNRDSILKVFLFSTLPILLLMIGLFLFEQYKIPVLKLGFMRFLIEPDTLRDCLDKAQCKAWDYSSMAIGRSGGLFLDANAAALFVIFYNLIALRFIFLDWRKPLNYLLFATGTTALLCTGSFTGIYAFVILFLMMLFLKIMRSTPKKAVIVLLLLIPIFFAGLELLPRYLPRLERDKEFNSFHGRIPIWKASLSVIKDNWFRGVGLDQDNWNKNYNVYAPRYNAPLSIPAHNMFLFLWGKSGIFAILFLLTFLAKLFIDNLSSYLSRGETFDLLASTIVVCVVIFAMVQNMLFMDWRISGTFFMLMGLSGIKKGESNNDTVN